LKVIVVVIVVVVVVGVGVRVVREVKVVVKVIVVEFDLLKSLSFYIEIGDIVEALNFLQ